MRLLASDARQAVFAPLSERPGRTEAVVRRLGSAIAMGIIVDGEQLPAEAQLAASLNVSTVTLREALSDLRARGLVETRRGRGGGSFVRVSHDALADLSRGRLRDLASTDLRELGDMRAAVSGAAARLAAERATTAEVNRLREVTTRLEAATDEPEQRRIEGRYYIDVAAIAQSVRLTRMEIDLQAELSQLLWSSHRSPDELADAVASHRRVIDAIAKRDGALARELTETHIAATTTRLIELHMRLTRESLGGAEREPVASTPTGWQADGTSTNDHAPALEDG
ncbi:GntR family transcriptional regulator [Mycolicibacterium agri]|uniref:GntR family transcriptional regulator n=1 Tax=Mycolicibacterium agri TaxID=36811 RepID=A0A2A7MRN9_MYCAG|nr:FCD domain-containing protein [Mycolicibacterium agri]PEG33991.1 GntR family transcriptional regulator [Mycolicibacterium agri]GFG50890.1 GntR family transcriptional regulator [Mycolicibacterium agri]